MKLIEWVAVDQAADHLVTLMQTQQVGFRGRMVGGREETLVRRRQQNCNARCTSRMLMAQLTDLPS